MIRSMPRSEGGGKAVFAFATCAHAHLYYIHRCAAILLWEVLTAVMLEALRTKQQHSSGAVAGTRGSSDTVADAVRLQDMPGKYTFSKVHLAPLSFARACRYEGQMQSQRLRMVSDSELRLEQFQAERKDEKRRYEEALDRLKQVNPLCWAVPPMLALVLMTKDWVLASCQTASSMTVLTHRTFCSKAAALISRGHMELAGWRSALQRHVTGHAPLQHQRLPLGVDTVQHQRLPL